MCGHTELDENDGETIASIMPERICSRAVRCSLRLPPLEVANWRHSNKVREHFLLHFKRGSLDQVKM